MLLACLTGPAAAQESLPAITEILVPAENPAAWPAGDWVTMTRRDYDALRAAAQPKPLAPRSAWIEQVEYTAELAGDALRGGTLAATVRHTEAAAQLVPLDPLGLTVEALWWEVPAGTAAPEALWGTAADGRTALLMDRRDATLRGRWSLTGRPLSQGTEFDVRLMPATVSRLRLRVPADQTVQSSAGDVVTEADDDPHFHWHTIHLGSQNHCRLRIVPARADGSPKSQILVTSDVTHLVRRDGLQLQARLTLDVLKEPVGRLTFRLPAEVEPYAVSWGSDTQLAWIVRPAGAWQTLLVDLPEPMIGRSRPIRIQALAPARLGERWTLPRITLQGASFLGGQYHLSVERPLQMQSLRSRGFRQTATVARPGEGATYTFSRFAPDARIEAVIDHPPLDLSSRTVARLDVAGDGGTLTANVTWQARAGTTFTTRCAIASTWEVTEVHLLADGTGPALPVNWDVQPAAGRGSVLLIELPDSLGEGESRTVRIAARRAAAAGEPTRLPVVQPLGPDDADDGERLTSNEGLLAIVHRPSDTLRLTDAVSLLPVERTAVPDFARTAPLWGELDAEKGRQVRLLYATTTAARATLAVESAEPPLDAAAQLTFDLHAGQAAEHLAFEIEPQGEPVETVLVYLSGPTEKLEWRLPGERDVNVTARRLGLMRHAEWELPASGELWELRLSHPLTETFRLVADRAAPLVPGEDLLLATLPQAREFSATVELRMHGETDWDVEAHGLRPLPGRPAAEPAGGARRWQYGDLRDGLALRLREAHRDAARDRLAALHVRSLLAPAGGGDDLHEARYTVAPTGRAATFRFTLPEPAALLDVTLNGAAVTATRRGTEFLLPLPAAAQAGEVRLRYRTPAASGLLRQTHRVPLPTASHAVLNFEWTIAIPPGGELAALPAGVRLWEPLPEPSWTARLFGPLGRPAGASVFNPLRWVAGAGASPPPANGSSMNAGEALDWGIAKPLPQPPEGMHDVPAGWTVWHASAPRLPDELMLTIADRDRSRTLAWLCLLGSLTGGLALRLWRVPSRQRVAAVWLAGMAALAWVLPAFWAELAGGGVAGAVLSMLLPRRVLFRPARHEGSEASTVDGHDHRLRGATIMIFLLAVGLSVSQAIGQPTGAAAVPEFAVMLPVDADGQPAGPHVYITKPLKDRLQRLAAPPSPAGHSLISSAEYRGRVDRQNLVTIEARYRVAVLPTDGPVRVALPLTGGHLSGPDACRVDGVPRDLLTAADGEAFVIELENQPPVAAPLPGSAGVSPARGAAETAALPGDVRQFEVVLSLLVPPTLAGRGGQFTLQIPPVADSRLSLTFDTPALHRDVLGSRGAVEATGRGRGLRAALGLTEQFEVVWSADAEPPPAREPLDAKIACLVEAQAAALQLRYRVFYSGTRGGVGSVSWRIPEELVPRIPADAPYTWSLVPAPGRQQLFVMDFTTPQTGRFVLDVPFLLPLRTPEGLVRVPRLTPTVPETTVSSYQVGVLISPATPFFTLTAQTTDREGLERITAGTFAESFQRGLTAADVKTPEVAWQVTKPVEPVFRLELVEPRRRVLWQEQVGRVTTGTLSWTMTAQVETTAAPAFGHTLRVDPALRIGSISVREDETERLLHWTRRGNQVSLFLSDKTTGRQTIRVEGQQPLDPDGPTTLPLARVEGAETVDSQLTLVRSDELAVELEPTDALSPLGAPLPGTVSETIRPVGQYRILPGAAPRIQVRRREDRPQVETAATILAGPTADERRLRTAFHIGRMSESAEPVRIQIPAELTEGHELAATAAEITLEPQADGAIDVIVHPRAGVEGEPVVTLTTLLPLRDEEPWPLPAIPLFGASAGTHYFALPRPAAWLPQETEALPVPARELPLWAAEALALPGGPEQWTVFRAEHLPWMLAAAAEDGGTEPLRVTLLETQLWLERDGATWGRSTLILPAGRAQRLTLAWPAGLTLRAALADGRPVAAAPATEAGQLSLRVEQSPAPRGVVLVWHGDPPADGTPPLGPQSAAIPRLTETTPEQNLITILSPEDRALLHQTGLDPASSVDAALGRLHGLLAAFPAVPPPSAAPSPLRQAVVAQYDHLARALTRQPLATNEERADELRGLRDRIAALRPTDEAAPPPDVPLSGAWQAGQQALATGWPTDDTGTLAVWTLDTPLWQALLGAAVGLVALVLLWKLLTPARTDALHTHPARVGLLLGVVWWLLLTPSLIGLALIAVSLTAALRRRAPT